jgi:hypothetical protein
MAEIFQRNSLVQPAFQALSQRRILKTLYLLGCDAMQSGKSSQTFGGTYLNLYRRRVSKACFFSFFGSVFDPEV